jgi:hypothetical protein
MTACCLNWVGNTSLNFQIIYSNSSSSGHVAISSNVKLRATSVLLPRHENDQLGMEKIVSRFTTVGYFRNQYSVKKRCTLFDLEISHAYAFTWQSPFALRKGNTSPIDIK